eukprot:CAMPEP_0173196902 /NCGR_PEP_ID=MMETSP1141-20130122/15871_1 /TAXON_ID=483371 /ORGANISM="non described non described, Strain CCMP2298" /LENGTH=103 /DNA_ID=CAMNT_0014121599 /DNA_START=144 /DNA_END=451 /DNA_ORIENTATION=+
MKVFLVLIMLGLAQSLEFLDLFSYNKLVKATLGGGPTDESTQQFTDLVGKGEEKEAHKKISTTTTNNLRTAPLRDGDVGAPVVAAAVQFLDLSADTAVTAVAA